MHTGAVRTSDLASFRGGEEEVATVVGVLSFFVFFGDFFTFSFFSTPFFPFDLFIVESASFDAAEEDDEEEEKRVDPCKDRARACFKSSSSVEYTSPTSLFKPERDISAVVKIETLIPPRALSRTE